LAETGDVVMGNVAVVAFAGMVTLVGTLAAERLLLLKVISAPLAGAGPFRVTLPVDGEPP
jgi:hypothetical protein